MTTHTDHPMKHWDRTCPACNEGATMNDLRKAAEMALEALEVATTPLASDRQEVLKAQQALRQALAQPEQSQTSGYAKKIESLIKERDDLRQALAQLDSTSDSATRSADSAESFCKQELHNLMSVAGRMALELECLLLDTKDLSVVSEWWDTGMESLQAYRDYIWSITHGKEEIIALAQPEQEPVAYWNGKDMFKRADEVQYVVNWTDYYHYPLYSEPVKERISEPLANQEPVDRQTLIDCVAGSIIYHFDMSLLQKKVLATAEYIVDHYTASPKREWVGLTDEEMNYLWDITPPEYQDRFALARAIEAKLKEKNT